MKTPEQVQQELAPLIEPFGQTVTVERTSKVMLAITVEQPAEGQLKNVRAGRCVSEDVFNGEGVALAIAYDLLAANLSTQLRHLEEQQEHHDEDR